MSSFILAALARSYPEAQTASFEALVFDNCFARLDEPDFLLRQWTALCIGMIWGGNGRIKEYGVDMGVQDRLIAMLSDDAAEVRAAALYALSSFLGASTSLSPTDKGGGGSGAMEQLAERVHFRMEVAVATGATLGIKDDASPMCRKELIVLLSALVREWRGYFVVCAWIYWEEDRKFRSRDDEQHDEEDDIPHSTIEDWLDNLDIPHGTSPESYRSESRVLLSSIFTMFVALLDLSFDPYPEVKKMASTVVDWIMALLLESPFARLERGGVGGAKGPWAPKQQEGEADCRGLGVGPSITRATNNGFTRPPPPSPRPAMLRGETERSLKRTSSFASALRSLAGIPFPHAEEKEDRIESRPSSPSIHVALPARDITRPPSPALNVVQYIPPYLPPALNANANHVDQSVIYDPCDALEALIAEDIERLKARRRKRGSRGERYHGHHSSASTFSTDSMILGLGTGAGMKDVLPLKSTYFDWCAEYFREPQMRVRLCSFPLEPFFFSLRSL